MTHEEAIIVISSVAWLGNDNDRKKIERAIKKLSESPTRSGKPNNWIPVSERLPEKNEVVLITNEKGNVRCGQYRYTDGEYWVWKGNTLEKVVAWQPLPECYRGEEE